MQNELKDCNCDEVCPVCNGKKANDLSIVKGNFWDLWLQKILRNFASMKFQWMVILYVPTIWGMFNIKPGSDPAEPWISAALGLGFLGGGFITLATSRIVARTKLVEPKNGNGGVSVGATTPKRFDTDAPVPNFDTDAAPRHFDTDK